MSEIHCVLSKAGYHGPCTWPWSPFVKRASSEGSPLGASGVLALRVTPVKDFVLSVPVFSAKESGDEVGSMGRALGLAPLTAGVWPDHMGLMQALGY